MKNKKTNMKTGKNRKNKKTTRKKHMKQSENKKNINMKNMEDNCGPRAELRIGFVTEQKLPFQ